MPRPLPGPAARSQAQCLAQRDKTIRSCKASRATRQAWPASSPMMPPLCNKQPGRVPDRSRFGWMTNQPTSTNQTNHTNQTNQTGLVGVGWLVCLVGLVGLVGAGWWSFAELCSVQYSCHIGAGLRSRHVTPTTRPRRPSRHQPANEV